MTMNSKAFLIFSKHKYHTWGEKRSNWKGILMQYDQSMNLVTSIWHVLLAKCRWHVPWPNSVLCYIWEFIPRTCLALIQPLSQHQQLAFQKFLSMHWALFYPHPCPKPLTVDRDYLHLKVGTWLKSTTGGSTTHRVIL